MAHAIRFHEPGGPEVLQLEEVEVGSPGPGQVRLKHVAVGLNFADTYFRSGFYPVPLPAGMGVEASGIVEAVGEGVTNVVSAIRDLHWFSTRWALTAPSGSFRPRR
jgi:NADPH2:quinone reductase